MLTIKEKELVDEIIKNIDNLKFAIASPNYPDTTMTKNTLLKYETKLEVLKKSSKFNNYIISLNN